MDWCPFLAGTFGSATAPRLVSCGSRYGTAGTRHRVAPLTLTGAEREVSVVATGTPVPETPRTGGGPAVQASPPPVGSSAEPGPARFWKSAQFWVPSSLRDTPLVPSPGLGDPRRADSETPRQTPCVTCVTSETQEASICPKRHEGLKRLARTATRPLASTSFDACDLPSLVARGG